MKKSFAILNIVLFLGILASSGTILAQEEPIRLFREKISVNSSDFYFKNVFDDRVDKKYFAGLFFSQPGHKPELFQIDLQGGSYQSVRDFLLQASDRNTAARPVNIRILECRINETLSAGNRVSGQMILELQFDLAKESGDVELTRYKTTARYSRSLNDPGDIEPGFRKLLVNGLKFFNGWMDKESRTNLLFAKQVRISFSDLIKHDPDTVYYQRNRPLTWNDFRAKAPAGSRFNAAVFPSIGYDLNRELKNGTIYVEMALKVYVAKSSSWASSEIMSSYSLNHEQRHFDLVKLIAERFKKKLLSEKLEPDNYEGIINFEYIESYREMNRLQERYDKETNHGQDRVAQFEWNKWIDRELEMLSPKAVL